MKISLTPDGLDTFYPTKYMMIKDYAPESILKL